MADAEFGDAVAAFLREQGWTLSTNQLASGVFLVGGERGDSEQLFALVGSSPSTPLTRDHVEYLCKTVERDGADRAVVVPREGLSQEALQFADEHGVTVLAQDAIRSTAAETGDEGGDGSAVSVPPVVTTRRAVVAGSLALGGLAVGGATASQVFDGVSIGGLGGVGTGTPDDGPETVVREFLRAVAHGDEEAAHALVHENSSRVDDDQLSATEITVHGVAQRDLRTLLNSTGDFDEEELDAEVQAVEAELDSLLADAGASEYGLVTIDVTTPDHPDRTRSIALTVRDDGEWFVYDTSIGLGASEATEPTVTATDRPSRALSLTTASGDPTDVDLTDPTTIGDDYVEL